ncbi:hypothetical protein SAMN02745824_0865 [Parasphingorhabdus marina DSM 22363]|uniref:Uncharacterized protein n=2 Tax=Parasphingorhabdus marina TaxID=394732 RepID=A0A1N6CS27_9SPHN|nr:hypothetical protein SAMN02745824_0865 [Parasphingorhabdus marina DSM 22363]
MQLEHDLRQCLETADGLKLRIAAIRINEALEELKSVREQGNGENRPKLASDARDHNRDRGSKKGAQF